MRRFALVGKNTDSGKQMETGTFVWISSINIRYSCWHNIETLWATSGGQPSRCRDHFFLPIRGPLESTNALISSGSSTLLKVWIRLMICFRKRSFIDCAVLKFCTNSVSLCNNIYLRLKISDIFQLSVTGFFNQNSLCCTLMLLKLAFKAKCSRTRN